MNMKIKELQSIVTDLKLNERKQKDDLEEMRIKLWEVDSVEELKRWIIETEEKYEREIQYYKN